MGTKMCRVCKLEKGYSEFFKKAEGGFGLGTICKPCNAIVTRNWRSANRDAYRQYCRGRRTKDAPRRRAYQLMKMYGLTPVDYNRFVVDQSGRCAICRRLPTGKRHCNQLHVDHDHTTGVVRGLLCAGCNRMVGRVKDNPLIFDYAASYLRKFI